MSAKPERAPLPRAASPGPDFLRRGQKLDLEEHVGWYCRPFRGRPRPHQWQALIDRVAEAVAVQGVRLVVDPLAAFYPGKSENDAAAMLDALAPLQGLAAQGPAVLVQHHPAKHDGEAGPSGRGSGALLGCADILIEMRWYRRAAPEDRRRKLQAFSRYPDTPRQLVIELNAEGTDYAGLGTFAQEEFAASWQCLRQVLEAASGPLTRRDIRRCWPAVPPPEYSTILRWLETAAAQGLVRKAGKGIRSQPFRYWLPSREAAWREDPLAFLHMPEVFLSADPTNES